MGTLVALNGGSTQFLGYATSEIFNGICGRTATGPVITVDNKMLMGICHNQALLQFMITNPPSFVDLSYSNILNTLSFLNDIEKFRNSLILIITISGEIYIWNHGDLFHMDGTYMAVGDGTALAMGCMFGVYMSEMDPLGKIEVTLNAVNNFIPSNSMTMGIEKI